MESENNKQSSKPNFTNFASELLKDCQRDLSEMGKKNVLMKKKTTSEPLNVGVLEGKTATERKLQRDSIIEDA